MDDRASSGATGSVPAPQDVSRLRDLVGVVIITRDRANELRAALRRVRALERGLAVVVVDNASTDDTTGVVRREFPDVCLIEMPENAGAAGRNVGVAALSTPYVAFADDDTWWDAHSLERAVERFEGEPDLSVLCGRFVVEPGGRPDPATAVFAASPWELPGGLAGRRVLGFLAGASVVRRSAFLAVGGFHARLGVGGEESLVAWDMTARGGMCVYDQDVVAHHQPSPARDIGRRDEVQARNELWSAWLRRPIVDAARLTMEHVLRARRDRPRRRALVEALRGVPWVVRERRVLPADVARDLRSLDASRARPGCASRSFVG